MKEVELTDEQYEYLESLREEIKREVVGPYGHVRIVDAVQYLIDNHEGEVDVEVATEGAVEDVDADDVTTETGDSDAADEEPGDDGSADTTDLEAIDGIGPSRAADLVEAGYETVEAVAAADPAELAEIDGISEAQAQEIMAGIEANGADDNGTTETNDEPSTDATGGDDSGAIRTGPSPTGGDDAGMLSSMQQLLQEHEEKWTEASDTGYEVELPDGSIESAPTKDDVRALLFRHYN